MLVAAESVVPFGILGIAIVVGFLIWLARSRNSTINRECPYCKKRLRGDASVCPHCQRESTPWTLKDGVWWRQDDAGGWEYRQTTGDGGARWRTFQPTTVTDESAAMREP